MLKKNKKQVVLALLIVLCVFLVSILFVFFYFNRGKSEDKNQLVSTSFKESQTIILKNTLPISDELGRNIDGVGTEEGIQGYVVMSIQNNTDKDVNYDIYITKKEIEKEIKENYIKLYLTDEADNPLEGYEQNSVPTYNDMFSLVDFPAARLLYNGSLKGRENRKVVLRAWLSDSYAVSNEEKSFTFDVNVRAK